MMKVLRGRGDEGQPFGGWANPFYYTANEPSPCKRQVAPGTAPNGRNPGIYHSIGVGDETISGSKDSSQKCTKKEKKIARTTQIVFVTFKIPHATPPAPTRTCDDGQKP